MSYFISSIWFIISFIYSARELTELRWLVCEFRPAVIFEGDYISMISFAVSSIIIVDPRLSYTPIVIFRASEVSDCGTEKRVELRLRDCWS